MLHWYANVLNWVSSQNGVCEKDSKTERGVCALVRSTFARWQSERGGLRFDSGRLLFPRRSHVARRVAYVSGAVGGWAGGRADSTRPAGTESVQCGDSCNKERQIELHFPCPQALLICSCASCQVTDSTREQRTSNRDLTFVELKGQDLQKGLWSRPNSVFKKFLGVPKNWVFLRRILFVLGQWRSFCPRDSNRHTTLSSRSSPESSALPWPSCITWGCIHITASLGLGWSGTTRIYTTQWWVKSTMLTF